MNAWRGVNRDLNPTLAKRLDVDRHVTDPKRLVGFAAQHEHSSHACPNPITRFRGKRVGHTIAAMPQSSSSHSFTRAFASVREAVVNSVLEDAASSQNAMTLGLEADPFHQPGSQGFRVREVQLVQRLEPAEVSHNLVADRGVTRRIPLGDLSGLPVSLFPWRP